MTDRRYSLEPLVVAMGLSWSAAQKPLGIGGPEYRKYRDQGVNRETAERKADRAGFHVYEIWPEMAEHDLEAITRTCAARNCEEPFVLSMHGGPNRLYCSRKCKSRENRRRHYQKNPEPQKARHRAYLAETADYQKRQKRAWYRANRDRILEERRARYARNAEVEKAAERARRERRRNEERRDAA